MADHTPYSSGSNDRKRKDWRDGGFAIPYSNRIYHATLILVRAGRQLGKAFNFRDILSLFDSPEISIKILKDELRQTGLYESLTEVQNLIGESKNVQGFKDVVSNMIAKTCRAWPLLKRGISSAPRLPT